MRNKIKKIKKVFKENYEELFILITFAGAIVFLVIIGSLSLIHEIYGDVLVTP
tara:strand:- start:286 stop:444 length:159 start_codon:yes stop_codon:yes gene_type:complete